MEVARIVGPGKTIQSQVDQLGGEQKKLPMPAPAMNAGELIHRTGPASTQPTG